MRSFVFKRAATLYALRDPRDNRVRWVGQAEDAEARLRTHMYPCRTDMSPRAEWVRSMKADGVRPVVEVLEHGVFGLREIGERERHWMSVMLAKGEPLLNVMRPGYRRSNATCLKISKSHNRRAAAKRAASARWTARASIDAVEPALADTLPPPSEVA